MMESLLTSVSSACAAGQSALTKYASTKVKNTGALSFSMLLSFTACAVFALLSFKDFHLHLPTVLYAFLHGISALLSTVLGYLALSCGMMAVTSLICSYSVIIPCIFGIALWGERISFVRILGFLLLAVSLYLLCAGDMSGGILKKKWVFYTAGTFLFNGVSSVIQKQHQLKYPGEFCGEFTFFSFFTIFAVLFVFTAVKKERCSARASVYAIPAGVFMGAANFLSLYLSAQTDATVLFPMMTIFKVIFSCVLSRIIFKDIFGVSKIIGIVLGVSSVLMIK